MNVLSTMHGKRREDDASWPVQRSRKVGKQTQSTVIRYASLYSAARETGRQGTSEGRTERSAADLENGTKLEVGHEARLVPRGLLV